MKLRDIVALIDKVLPGDLVEEGDSCGLLIGDMDKDINHIRMALEASEEVILSAAADGVDLLVVHHPMIYTSLRTVTSESLRGRKVLKMVQHGIALYAAHSNLDRAMGGLNQSFGHKLGFTDMKVYDEEGFILIGQLEVPVPLGTYAREIREMLGLTTLRYVGDADKEITRVAFCTGSGIGLLTDGLFEEADVYITGDLKYHDAMDIHEKGQAVIDVTHFGSEVIAAEVLYDLVGSVVDSVELSIDRSVVNPIKDIIA